METNIDGGAETGAVWQMYKVIYEWIDLNSVSIVQAKIIWNSTLEEKRELCTSSQFSAALQPYLINALIYVLNKGFSWPACKEFRYPNSIKLI